VNGGVSATSLFANSNASIVETNSNVVASRLRTTTTAQSLVGGKAEVVNDAGGVVKGDVTVLGATGSVTNAGVIAGAIKLGSSNATLANGTLVQQQSVSADTGGVFTASTTPFAQSYTVNQNGVSRGISVLAAQITNPDQTKQLASNVTATINLNNGSATLGSIEGARDATTGAFLTDTTLNLDGNGFLGVDRALTAAQVVAGATPTRNPQLVLSKDATDAGFTTSATTVRITGVNTVNKTGSGTFVITGTAYTPATASVPAQYTLDVGSLNVKAGELQLGLDPSVADAKFGIKGAITVSDGATLLLGRRVPVSTATPVSSLTGAGETILATNVVLAGDYNQTAGGKTIAVITPSLVRASVAVTPSSSTTEILGPVAGTVNVGFFTTPAVLNGGTPAANSRVDVTGNVNLAGQVVLNLSRDSLFATGDNSTLFTYTGTADVSKATVAPSLTSRFVSFALVNDAATKTIGLTTTRNSYATGATNPNAAAAAAGLDSALTAAAGAIKADAAGAVVFPTVQAYGMAQDVANISAGLDWRLSAAAAAQVFDELSSAEFYGSLSNIRQNAAFTSAAERLTQPRATDLPVGASLWVSPSGTFSKFDASGSGASSVRVDSYGGAAGVDLSYGNGGAMGFGMAYGQHDADGRGRTEHARVRTTTLGAYWTHNFGNLYANAQFSYGFSEFDTRRTLSLLARTITANYRGSEWDGRVQVGYKVEAGDLILTPFGELALRHWSTRDYNEQGGAGIGLAVSRASKSVFNPTIGGKIAYDMEIGDSFHLRPYGKLSYTFQGNAGVDRTVRYLAGGNSFVLNGVDPKGFGTIEGGLDAALNDKLGVFFGGGYSFAGSQKFGRIQSGLNINF
jgi:uncharacterized protein with beta-barrel porin domain